MRAHGAREGEREGGGGRGEGGELEGGVNSRQSSPPPPHNLTPPVRPDLELELRCGECSPSQEVENLL